MKAKARRLVVCKMDSSTSIEKMSIENETQTIAAAIESTVQENDIGPTNQYDCPICYETYDHGHLVALKCGHIFHRNCLTMWFISGTTCPKCNQKSSMESALPIFLDDTIHGGQNNINHNCLDGTTAVPISQMKETLIATKRKLNDRFNSSRGYSILLLIFLCSIFALSFTTEECLKATSRLIDKCIILSRYDKELEVYIDKNLSDVKYDRNNNKLRDEYINQKGFLLYTKTRYALVFGCYFGILFGALNLIAFILYKKLGKLSFLRKKQGHIESNNAEQFENLIKKLAKVYDTAYIVLKYCIGLCAIYLLFIVFNVLYCRSYKNTLTADYASLLENNVKQLELLVEHHHDLKHTKSKIYIRKQYDHEWMTNESEKIYLNLFMIIFTSVGAFLITALCSRELALSKFKYLVLTRKINKILKCPTAPIENQTTAA